MKNKKHDFKDSEFYDIQKFKAAFDDKYKGIDLDYYHESAELYSESVGEQYKNWVAAVKNWIRKDIQQNKAVKMKLVHKPQQSTVQFGIDVKGAHKEFQEAIINSFNNYREKGTISQLWINMGVFRFWNKRGVLKGDITQADEEAAKNEILEEIKNDLYKREEFTDTKSLTNIKHRQRLIIEFYDKVIKEKKPIEKYF